MKRLLAAFVLVLSGCSGGGSTVANTGPTCVLHAFQAGAPLVFPADGAKNVPTTVGSVAVAYQAELVGTTVYLQPNGSSAPDGGRIAGGVFAPSVGGMTLAASIPPLASGTTYFVTASTSQGGAPCPQTTFWTFGTFTTS